MGRYFVRGRAPGGGITTERVDAPDATAALGKLSARGYSELVLLSSAFEEAPAPDEEKLLAAEQAAMPFHGDWYTAWLVVKSGWLLWAPALAYLGYRRALARPLGVWDFVAIALVVLVVGLALRASIAVLPYRRMLRAVALGRWEEVLQRVSALERDRRLSKQIPPSELHFRRASALLRLGREAEADAALAAGRADGSQPAWLLDARTGDHYSARGDMARAGAHYEAAVAHSPEIAETHLVLGEFRAGHRVRDPKGARECLARALQYPVAESVRWAATKIEGLVLLEEGDARGALSKLRAARRDFRSLTDSGLNVLADSYMGAYCCLCYAALGDRESALRELRAAEPWLEPHGLDDLLKRCRDAAGATTAA